MFVGYAVGTFTSCSAMLPALSVATTRALAGGVGYFTVNDVPLMDSLPPSATTFAPFSVVPVTVTSSLIFTGLVGAFTDRAGGVLSTVNVRVTLALPRKLFGAVILSTCSPSARPFRCSTRASRSVSSGTDLPSTVALIASTSTPSGTTLTTDAARASLLTSAFSSRPVTASLPPVVARAVGTVTARATTTATGTRTAGRRRRGTGVEG